MLMEEMAFIFEKHAGDYDTGLADKSSPKDLQAFLFLNTLLPGNKDMVACAEHDWICLSVDVDELASVITEEGIHFLIDCGVRYNETYGSLSMFV